MSRMRQAKQIGDNRYELLGKGRHANILAFLSPELYNKTKEDMWQQAVDAATLPGVMLEFLMPDVHKGYGVPIGGVVVTKDTLIPMGSGYDISCGVLYLKVPGLSVKRIRSKQRRREWIEELEKRIPTGMGYSRPSLMPSFSSTEIEEIMHFGAKALGVKSDLCERQFIPIPASFNPRVIEKAWKPAQLQMGSLGGGNHFIEMQVDANDGSVWVMIHSGSRGYGHKTAEYFLRKLKAEMKVRQDATWVKFDSEIGQAYWNHHNSAANYAIANRHTMAKSVRESLQEVFDVDGEVYYEISHNLVQQETIKLEVKSKSLDGKVGTPPPKYFVHRKGATRAFPAKHPDLSPSSKWYYTGHPCLIPGSMMDGAAILFPLEGAYESGCSVNHGSGRVMGRKDAKKSFSELQGMINAEMNDIQRTFNGVKVDGIISNHRNIPLDECAHVYKDLDTVLAILESEGIAKVAQRMYPVANIKG
jgi:tRNA-splicing ligase RtcB (3'-phosphate/5'-hydroxy nucleic acid ligase)